MKNQKAERRRVQPLPQTDVNNIRLAINDLRGVRDRLRFAGANKAADYVARALKSAEGAERNAIARKNWNEWKAGNITGAELAKTYGL